MSANSSIVYSALWFVVIFQAILLLAVLREIAIVRQAIAHGGSLIKNKLPIGSFAPEFLGQTSATSQRVSVESFKGRGGVILFLSPDCSICTDLAKSITQLPFEPLPQIIAFSRGDREHSSHLVVDLASKNIPLIFVGAEETFALYRVIGSPTAVIVDDELRIRRYGHPRDGNELEALFSKPLSTDGEANGYSSESLLESEQAVL